jgi:hypothetical protein
VIVTSQAGARRGDARPEAEDHVATAKTEARDRLQQDVENAPEEDPGSR